jgi:FKBP-type peptidyl-prolyl cis-trans isomerase SlyD
MEATYGAVVTLDYTLSLESGEVMGGSRDRVEYLHGYYNIIPALERALEGARVGDRRSVVLEPADAYGEHEATRVVTVPIDSVPDGRALKPGMRIMAETGRGPVELTVSEVNDDSVVFDANHPLAGKRLHFDVEVMDIRTAARHELAQGYPGPQACSTFT